MTTIGGIHHVSAICGDPRRNLEFYVGCLGLRLVKKTVNYDDPGSYHLYYGDGVGSPGTLITFFAWIGLPPMVIGQGRQGPGQIATVAFAIPRASLDFWVDRLAAAAVDFDGPEERFGDRVLTVRDPDGVHVELIASGDGGPVAERWEGSSVPAEHAIRRLHGVSLCLAGFESTARLLTETLGFRRAGEEGGRFRFLVGEGGNTAAVDIRVQPDAQPGRMGIGIIHHVAWRVADRAAQEAWRDRIVQAGLDVTPILDRRYFESIYFTEPGGVVFEIATDGPGFTVDEPQAELGTHLALPPWLEARRAAIASRLPDLNQKAP